MASGTTINQMIDVVTPAAGESVTEGTILEWHVKIGDFIKVDDTIVEISTDKVDVELPSPASGTIVEILAEEGDTVGVGQVIARIAAGDGGSAQSSGDGAPSADGGDSATEPRVGSSTQASTATAQTGTSASQGTDAPQATSDGATTLPDGKRVSPVAARVAATEDVDLAAVPGSGPGGRIVKADVLGVVANGGPATTNGKSTAASEPAGERRLLKGGAAMLARYMDESRSTPTATSFRTLTVTALDGRRRELKAGGRKVSFTHLIAYAIVQAADEMPSMVHHFAEIEGKPYRIEDGAVNLGLAVDVEKKDGSRTLMVPVIRGADRLSFEEFLAAYDALVEKARTNTLTTDDLTGANITLTNPGGLGTIASVPRLMNGQGTIVATGSIAYPVGLGAVGEQVGAEKVMTMTSTYDHRVIQGAESGRFLGLIEQRLQGEQHFYESVFASLGVALGPAPTAPPPTGLTAAAPPTGGAGSRFKRARPTSRCCRPCRLPAHLCIASAAMGIWRRVWIHLAQSPRASRNSIRKPPA